MGLAAMSTDPARSGPSLRGKTVDNCELNCKPTEETMAKEKFIIEPHFRLQEWVAEEKGYFKDEGLDYMFRELVQTTDGKHHDKGDKVGAMQSFEEGRAEQRELRLPLDGGRGRLEGQGPALWRCLFGLAFGHFRAAEFADQDTGAARGRADFGRLPVGQPLRDHPGARTLHAARQDQSDVRRRHAVRAARQSAGR